MYKALDEFIGDDKAIKQLSEQRSVGFDVLSKSFDVVKQFILNKKRIIYGGMSIDMALKAAGSDGIYAPDAIPDYDFMSPESYDDSIELADLLYKAFGDANIDAISALHPTTRRVRINFVPVADITYIPTDVYQKLPTLDYKGFRVIHPNYQRLDMHRAFCNPLELVPREVVFFRTNKDIKRFGLLDNAYPLTTPKLAVNKKSNVTIPTKYFAESMIGGSLGMALMSDTIKITRGDTLELEVPASLEKQFRVINIMTDDPIRLRDLIQEDFPRAEVKYYCKFGDDVRPPSIVMDVGDLVFDIHDTKGRRIPYSEIDGYKVVSGHGVLMTLLERSFNTNDRDQWLWMYCKLLEYFKRNPMTMSAETFGFYNWALSYLVNAQRQYAQIEGYEVPPTRPPGRYGPADGKKPLPWDPSTSWVFYMDGSEIPEFKELTLRMEIKKE